MLLQFRKLLFPPSACWRDRHLWREGKWRRGTGPWRIRSARDRDCHRSQKSRRLGSNFLTLRKKDSLTEVYWSRNLFIKSSRSNWSRLGDGTPPARPTTATARTREKATPVVIVRFLCYSDETIWMTDLLPRTLSALYFGCIRRPPNLNGKQFK